MLQMLEEEAYAQEYERLGPEQIDRVDGRNCSSGDTERGEKDWFFLSISEVESEPAEEDNEDPQGHEDSIQHILCYRVSCSALKHFSFLSNSPLKEQCPTPFSLTDVTPDLICNQ